MSASVAVLPSQAPSELSGSAGVSAFRQPVYIPLSTLICSKQAAQSSDQVAELDPTVFAHPIRCDILHLCVVHHLDSLRQGSANTKTRAEVRGSGRKIRPRRVPEKHVLATGKPHACWDFATKLPRKVIQMGMRVALSARVKEHNLRIVDELGWDHKTLFITGKDVVPMVSATTAQQVGVYDLVKWPRVVLDLEAAQWFEHQLGKTQSNRDVADSVVE
ncbi:ribosomal protein L4 domain-containing protein [Lactarius quietus]|nr:ribosomal protein L4 domain-containing protein [Lactarius quietus]